MKAAWYRGLVLLVGVAFFQMFQMPAARAQSTWNNSSGGSWSDKKNWSSNGVPNGVSANATLGSIITQDRTVTLDTKVTLGTLNIASDHSYTLQGNNANTLTFDAATGKTAYINVSGAGSSTLSATNLSVVLNDPTVINHSGTGVFSIDSNISGTGGLTYSGTSTGYGELGGSNTFTGALTVANGLLKLNSGLVNGAVANALVVGDGIGAANSAIARNMQEGQVANTATLTVKSDGWFDINAAAYPDQGGDPTHREETVGQVILSGGHITTGAPGSLKIDSSTASTTGITSTASTQTALIDATGGNVDINGDRTISVAKGTQTRDLEIKGSIVSSVAGADLTKTGAGQLTFSGAEANTYTGQTIVNGGTLELAKSNGVASIAGSSITVNSGGTLLLSSSQQINNSTGLTLAGGKLAINNVAGVESLGTLTLSGTSSIDLGTAAYLLNFADSSSLSCSWTGSLTIYGWTGNPNSSGTAGQIFFGNNLSGLTNSQLAMISFNGFGGHAMLLTSGELVPMCVPEAGTIFAALLLALIVLHREIGPIVGACRRWATSAAGLLT